VSRRVGALRPRTPFGWAILSVSALAIVAVLGGLLAYGLSGSDGRADLRVEVDRIGGEISGGVGYDLTIRNLGGASATDVLIILRVGDTEREIMIPLVAKGDEEQAVAVVPPGTTGEARAEVVSYSEE
jgi:uncharacterized protein (TIGR02588 family)